MAAHTSAGAPRLRVVHSSRPQSSSVRKLPNAVLGTLIFVACEVMLFAGLIAAFLVLRAGFDVWPPVDQPRLPVGLTAVNTIILLASGGLMFRAVRSATSVGDVRMWLGGAALLGTVFVLIQGSEWARLVSYGLTVNSSVYAGTFYVLVGCHAVHAIAGLLAMAVQLRRAIPGADFPALQEAVAGCGVFWFFVVGMWPILYVLVYLA